jgi:nicotinate-nucleotide pyrophosphorylase (carboxylating)
LEVDHVVSRVTAALDEDLAYGPDVTTTATVPAGQRVAASVTARTGGVLAGVPVALVTFDLVMGAGQWHLVEHRDDGAVLERGVAALVVEAPTRALLTAERTALNFLGHLSGVATVTAAWTAAIAPARVRDTRKTIPGLRVLDKYAVRCGGGLNHRMGLGDAALIKDNHVVAAGSVGAAISAVRNDAPSLPLEVECDRVDQVSEAIAAGAELILLDNMTTDQMTECVSLGRSAARPVQFEASGGLTLENAAEVAATGVDFVAVGALTHSAPVLDLGLDVLRVVAPSVGSSGD